MKRLLLPLALVTLLFSSVTPARADAGSETQARPLAGESGPELAAPRWQQMFPPTRPPARTDHAMAYDTARGAAVLFGGYIGGIAQDDTWEWDSVTMAWIERLPAHRPPPRFGAAMVYDQARAVVVMYGGVNSFAQEYDDTWLWNGTDWTQTFPDTSPPRAGSMA